MDKDLEKRVHQLEKVISKIIEAMGHDDREMRTYILKEAMEAMPL